MSVSIPQELDEYISDYSSFLSLKTPGALDNAAATLSVYSSQDSTYHYLMTQDEHVSATVLDSKTDDPIELADACFEFVAVPGKTGRYYIRNFSTGNYWRIADHDGGSSDPLIQVVDIARSGSELSSDSEFLLAEPSTFLSKRKKKYLTVCIVPADLDDLFVSVGVNRVHGLTLSSNPVSWIVRFKYLPKVLYTALLSDPAFSQACCRKDAGTVLKRFPNFLDACKESSLVPGNKLCASKKSFFRRFWWIFLIIGIIALIAVGLIVYKFASSGGYSLPNWGSSDNMT